MLWTIHLAISENCNSADLVTKCHPVRQPGISCKARMMILIIWSLTCESGISIFVRLIESLFEERRYSLGSAMLTSPDFHIYTCSFPEKLLASLSEGLRVGELDQLRGANEIICCRSDLMKQLQNQMRILCHSARSEEAFLCDLNIEQQLKFELPRLLLRTIAASKGVLVPATSHKREIAVTRVQAYIEGHYRHHISAKDLCHAAGVSQRTLEYAFDERFGVTP